MQCLTTQATTQLPTEVGEFIGLSIGDLVNQLQTFEPREQLNVVCSHRLILGVEELRTPSDHRLAARFGSSNYLEPPLVSDGGTDECLFRLGQITRLSNDVHRPDR